MEKAKIEVLDKKYNPVTGKTFVVMFNPNKYSLNLSANYGSQDLKNKSSLQAPPFTGTSLDDFSVELFFDSYELGLDVRKLDNGTDKIAQLALPSVKKKQVTRPPICRFSWGAFSYVGVISKVNQSFTMFLSNGTPVRATVTITIKHVVTDEKEMLKMMGVSDSRKSRTVKHGDRLDLLAEEELNDPSLWPIIAQANNIADPLHFPSKSDIGKVLIIPHQEA